MPEEPESGKHLLRVEARTAGAEGQGEPVPEGLEGPGGSPRIPRRGRPPPPVRTPPQGRYMGRPAPQASGGRWFPAAAITQGSGLSSLILPFGLRPQASVRKGRWLAQAKERWR